MYLRDSCNLFDVVLLDSRNTYCTCSIGIASVLFCKFDVSLGSTIASAFYDLMKQRQAEGIRMAKLRGVKFGRPSTPTPDDFDNIVKLYKEKRITVVTAINMSGLTRGAFYRKLNKLL